MEIEKFVSYRKRLGLTQKELAQLLVTSVKAIHSYEQGWRNIPDNVERQLLFLISGREKSASSPKPCWTIKKCLPERKKQCPAWKYKAGNLCWFINGTICEGLVQKNWSEKIQICRNCEVFKPIFDF
ncbi:MAG: helix-turn-helix transcriptional regulator [Thermodesulfobacteriota bacterium]